MLPGCQWFSQVIDRACLFGRLWISWDSCSQGRQCSGSGRSFPECLLGPKCRPLLSSSGFIGCPVPARKGCRMSWDSVRLLALLDKMPERARGLCFYTLEVQVGSRGEGQQQLVDLGTASLSLVSPSEPSFPSQPQSLSTYPPRCRLLHSWFPGAVLG